MYLETEPEIFSVFGQQLGAYLSPKPLYFMRITLCVGGGIV